MCALAATAPPTLAAEPEASFALKAIGAGASGYYSYGAAPGEVVSGRVRVVNAGDAPGTARLDMVDATTGATTGAVYENVENQPTDVGAWVELDKKTVTLAPGASTVVGFTVTVPAGARRGEHLGGIVAAPVAATPARGAQAKNKSFKVNVVNQSVLAIQVNLPGAARSLLAVRGVKAGGNTGYQTLLITLSNPGERMVRGSGRVELTDEAGKVVGTQRFAIDTFLPRTRIDYPLVVRGKALVPGDYRAKVSLDWGEGKLSEAFGFAVSRKNIEQAFGPEGVASLPDSGSSGGGGSMGLILAVVLALLLGIGGSVLYFRRHTRRLEERIIQRQAEAQEPRFDRDQDRESSPR